MRDLDAPEVRVTKFELPKENFAPKNKPLPEGLTVSQAFPREEQLIKIIKDIGRDFGWTRFPRFADRSYYKDIIEEPETRLYCFYKHGVEVGAAIIIGVEEQGSVEIEVMGLYEEFRNQGLGTAALECILADLYKDYNNVELLTCGFNPDATYDFYEKNGFKGHDIEDENGNNPWKNFLIAEEPAFFRNDTKPPSPPTL